MCLLSFTASLPKTGCSCFAFFVKLGIVSGTLSSIGGSIGPLGVCGGWLGTPGSSDDAVLGSLGGGGGGNPGGSDSGFGDLLLSLPVLAAPGGAGGGGGWLFEVSTICMSSSSFCGANGPQIAGIDGNGAKGAGGGGPAGGGGTDGDKESSDMSEGVPGTG